MNQSKSPFFRFLAPRVSLRSFEYLLASTGIRIVVRDSSTSRYIPRTRPGVYRVFYDGAARFTPSQPGEEPPALDRSFSSATP